LTFLGHLEKRNIQISIDSRDRAMDNILILVTVQPLIITNNYISYDSLDFLLLKRHI